MTKGTEKRVIDCIGMDAKDGKEDTVLALPMSRIKKIVKLDPEHISSTESANYVLGMATEMFVRQFAVDASEITRSKGRKKVMYADAQKAVSNVDIYAFMRDIVPKRAPIGELMSKGLVKLRPGDQLRMEESIARDGFANEEAEVEAEVEADAEDDDEEVGEEEEEEEEVEAEVEAEEEEDAGDGGEGLGVPEAQNGQDETGVEAQAAGTAAVDVDGDVSMQHGASAPAPV